ncbi:MAG: NnrS family protein [Nitrosomonas sp.]|nr:NnrS family protein [Nitrosomonas sp.]
MNQLTLIWEQLSAAPHRGPFLIGTIQGVLTFLWWNVDLLGRFGLIGGLPGLHGQIAPIWIHAFLMIYTFFPFFIIGFLFTTFPSWMNGEKIRSNWYMSVCGLMALGSLMFYIGLIYGQSLLLAGVLSLLLGWGLAILILFRVLLTASGGDKRHAWVCASAFVGGWLGLGAYALWLSTGIILFLDFSRQAGIWFFLLPILMAVSHRMIPFFSSRVLQDYVIVRPYLLLWVMLTCSILHGWLHFTGFEQYAWISDLLLALCALYLSYVWGFARGFSVRLLAVLHVAFIWLGLAMLLFSLQGFLAWSISEGEGQRYWFGLAPLHMLTIGYFASMVLGMASRVTLGHSGRPLKLDKYTWLLFLGFQAAVLFRALPEILSIALTWAPWFYLMAGGVWLICFMLWAGKYAPIFWRARADGKPG